MTILLIILLVIVAFLVVVAMRPNTIRYERSAVINAAPERLFPLVNDFHAWRKWSPWEDKDPQMQRTFEGPANGVGARYAWKGNKNVGEGSMEVKEAQPFGRVVIALDFIKPWEAHNTADFTFVPEGNGTRVNWVMTGPANFGTKLFGLLFNLDKMVGKDFEKGLAQLKVVAEQ